MTVMPALLQFSFLLTFPCTESFLKESQEDGNVPAVTLAGIAPGWISQAAKGCPRKESAAARPAPGAAEPASPCPLLTSVLQDTVFRGRIDGHRALLPEILHSCDHTPLTLPRHSSDRFPRGGRGFSSPSARQCRFRGMQDPGGAASNGSGPGCWCMRVPRSGSSQGGRLEVRAGSGF